MKIPVTVRFSNMIFRRQFHFVIKKSLILLGFLLLCPGVFAADWTTTQIRDIVNDVGKIEDHTSLANTYLSNIWSEIISFDSDFKYLNNQIYNELLTGNSTLNSLSTNSLNLIIETIQNGYKIEDGFQSVSNLLNQINTSISNLSNSSSSTNSFDLSVLDNIYSALTTNQLSFAGQTWDCLQNLSTNIDIYTSELLATNGIQISTLETCSSNIVFAISSLTNDIAGVNSKLENIDNYISTITNLLNNIDINLEDFYTYYTNTTSTILYQWFISNSKSKALLNYYHEYYDYLSQGNFDWRNIYNYLLEGYDFYPSGWNTVSGMSYNLAGLMQELKINSFYDSIYGGISSEIISNFYNTVTNKTQSIPYTVILPELSNVQNDPNIYAALTNAYLTSYNQQSDLNWFDRVELLLAALVFPDNSSTNTVEDANTAQSASEQTARQFTDQLNQVSQALVSHSVEQDFTQVSGHLSTLLTTLRENLVFRKPEIISAGTLEEPLDVLGERPTDAFVVDTTFGGLSGFIDFLRNLTSLLWVVLFFILAYKCILVIFKAYYSVYNFSQAIFRKILG